MISSGESVRDSLWGFIENGILEREGGITKGFLRGRYEKIPYTNV